MSSIKRRRHRRKLYVGGALMVLAPIGAAGCGSEAGSGPDNVTVAPADVVSEAPDGYVDPETIAIAPFDPGKIDTGVPEIIAIAPADMGPTDIIAIAPADPGPNDPGVPPEVIAIAPFDPGPNDPGKPPEIIAIAPFDPGPPHDPGTADVPKPGDPCFPEGKICSETLVCQAQAICIIATECCGGCSCQEVPCNPTNPWCPPGMKCEKVEGKNICTTGDK